MKQAAVHGELTLGKAPEDGLAVSDHGAIRSWRISIPGGARYTLEPGRPGAVSYLLTHSPPGTHRTSAQNTKKVPTHGIWIS